MQIQDIYLLFFKLVNGSSKTLCHSHVADQGPVRNLRVSEETTNSFRVSWQPAPGAVTRYRLTYEPIGDESSRMEVTTDGTETTTVLEELQPQTTYRVSVTPEYRSGPGVPRQTEGTTKEGDCSFQATIYTPLQIGRERCLALETSHSPQFLMHFASEIMNFLSVSLLTPTRTHRYSDIQIFKYQWNQCKLWLPVVAVFQCQSRIVPNEIRKRNTIV